MGADKLSLTFSKINYMLRYKYKLLLINYSEFNVPINQSLISRTSPIDYWSAYIGEEHLRLSQINHIALKLPKMQWNNIKTTELR